VRTYLLAVTCAILALSAAATNAATYKIRDLGVEPVQYLDQEYEVDLRINNAGCIAGAYTPLANPRVRRCFIWRDGVVTALAPTDLTRNVFTLTGMNAKGEISGYCRARVVDMLGTVAASWQPSDPIVPQLRSFASGIGLLGRAVAVNDKGWIAINESTNVEPAKTITYQDRGAIFKDGKLRYLQVPKGYRYASVVSVNNSGQVIGYCVKNNKKSRDESSAYLWQNGEAINLGSLPGCYSTVPICINDKGQIVCESLSEAGRKWFLWSNGKITPIEITGPVISILGIDNEGKVLLGSHYGWAGMWQDSKITIFKPNGLPPWKATAMNAKSRIAGTILYDNSTHACTFDNGMLTDLGTLEGGKNSLAFAINDNGTIVGISDAADMQFHVVIWEKVSD